MGTASMEDAKEAYDSSNELRISRRVLATLETAVCSMLLSAFSVSMICESAV